jgi:hypothetical protein
LAISTCQLSRRRSKWRKDPSIVPLKWSKRQQRAIAVRIKDSNEYWVKNHRSKQLPGTRRREKNKSQQFQLQHTGTNNQPNYLFCTNIAIQNGQRLLQRKWKRPQRWQRQPWWKKPWKK